MNSENKSNQIAIINFKIKIMLNCYLRGITSLNDMMSILQMNAFVVAACSSQEPHETEVTYATYLVGTDLDLKEYVKDPIKYVRLVTPRNALQSTLQGRQQNTQQTTQNNQAKSHMTKIINPYPHIFALSLVNGVDAGQKQALIRSEMMCKCISADLRCLAISIFIANTVHKIVVVEDSAIFLLEILNESAKIACDYLPTEMRGELWKCFTVTDENKLLDEFVDFSSVGGFAQTTAQENKIQYKPIYVICWVIRKMHMWINSAAKNTTTPNNEKIKMLFNFHADLMLDLEDLFDEAIEQRGGPNYLLFILPLLNALSGLIVASYCAKLGQLSREACLTQFAPPHKNQQGAKLYQNSKLYQNALSWIEGLLFEQ